MAQLYDIMKPESKYWDRKNYTSLQEYNAALQVSATVYVGNLSFYTHQGAIKELFSRAGNVKDIIMGIDNDGNPCGFCFVVYETKKEAELAVEYISKTRVGGRIIRVDLDPGFKEGREKGRGISGQQRRDDFRTRDDPQRPRKKVNTNYENSGRGDYNNRERGNYHHRGQRGQGGYRDRGDRGQGHRERGEGGYGRRDDGGYRGDRERGGDRKGDYRGGRDYNREDRADRTDRGERRDYKDNREQREQRDSSRPPREEAKPVVEQAEEDY